MATRSSIAIQHKDGAIESVYCHHDGYLAYVGTILLTAYVKESEIKALLKHGDISSLGCRLNPMKYDHSFNKPEKGTTVFYGRDRGDKNVGSKRHTSLQEYIDLRMDESCEFLYLWDDGEWFVYQTALPTLGFIPVVEGKTY